MEDPVNSPIIIPPMQMRSTLQAAAAAAFLAAAASDSHAQAWNYPSFQQPQIVQREFNFSVAEGGAPAGTSVLFQWREQVALRSQLTLEVGMAESEFWAADTHFLVGGQYAHQLARASAAMPFDFLLTVGLNGAMGDPFSLFRMPLGLSVGHRFDLDGPLAITPFAHPRLSYDRCSGCDAYGGDNTDLAFAFDLGAELRINPQLAMRLSMSIGGSDFFDDRWNGYYYLSDGRYSDDSFGLSVSWTPKGARAAVEPPRGRPRRP